MRANLSMQTVVFLVLGLMLFIILMITFKDKIDFFNLNAKSCESKDGYCVEKASDCSGSVKSYKCQDSERRICCVQSLG